LRLVIFAAATAVLAFAATSARAADGQAVYTKRCAVCHTKISPKLGDKAAWAPRISKGIDAMTLSTIKGKGKMPPQVGKSGLTNAEVRAAVEYMVQRSK
jgi:cytochrome c5